MTMDKAILAGGCFWGMEDLIRHLPGVVDTTVGYTGGAVLNPTYGNHDGHAEAIEITFDSTRLTYRALLEFFFQIHDPTTRNSQGNDIGTSYRSAIFYRDAAQKETAAALIGAMEEARLWPGQIVTELVAAGVFYPAENDHQDYLQRHPNGYTCHYIRPNWTLNRKETSS